MKSKVTYFKVFFLVITSLLIMSCEKHDPNQEKKNIEEATVVVKKIFEASNNFQFLKGLDYYSDTKEAYFVSDGTINSLEDLRKTYSQIGPSVEELHNTILGWNVQVLSEEVIVFTLPVRLKIKLKNIEAYTGELIWSAVLKKNQKGEWKVVQSHESWLNCCEAMKAMSGDQS